MNPRTNARLVPSPAAACGLGKHPEAGKLCGILRMKGALGMHRIIGIFLISLLTVSWPVGRIRWVTGDSFFFLCRQNEAMQENCSIAGGPACLPGRRVEGQHWEHIPPSSLHVASDPAVLAPRTELASVCTSCCGTVPTFCPLWFLFTATAENGRAKLRPQLCQTQPGWPMSC